MCGVTGFWTGVGVAEMDAVARHMAAAASHRGPDDHGEWTDADAGIALGHRRLSILDLTPEGHQPMASPGGRFRIVFNGEVYNFAAIRRELESARPELRFRGHSDTEVMLAAIEVWGLEAAVKRFVGMFAFALWDLAERKLHLVRDRLGIKPLFYGWNRGVFLFGSELQMLRAFPGFAAEVDRDSITLLLRHNCIPAPHSILRGIRKLPQGTILSLHSPREADAPQPAAYWSAAEVAARGIADPFRGSDAEAADELDALLRDAVALRMVADVPLGAFLSGGIDSSTVVALMQAQSDRPVKTFSIGSSDARADEARHACAVARHLGTDHTDLYVSANEALEVVPKLATMYDEPFADSSQIPTFLVSRLARREVTVSLSGDGGDELFAGYNRHVWVGKIWRQIGWLPAPVRRAAASAVLAVPQRGWEQLFDTLAPVLPPSLRHRWPGAKLHKLAGVAGVATPEDMYRALTSHWHDPASVVLGAAEPPTFQSQAGDGAGGLQDITQRMMYLDLVGYLPDDILTKVDRASMAVSLEARVPLIDHRVVEFAWRLPNHMKLRGTESKWLLRQVLYRYVPRELVDRPKEGFGIPLAGWLRGPLKEWAAALLDPARMRREGFLDPAPVAALWREHLAGRRSREYPLWDVLMFQAWLEAQGAG